MKFIMEYQANRSGIYAILNLMEKRIYIGKATKLQVRAYQHRDDLRKNLEPNLELQRDYNKPNARLIDFSLVEDVAQEDLLYYESLYIYVARSWENDESEISRLYNCSKSKIDLNGLVKNYNKEKSKVESDLEAAKENFNQALQIRFGGRGPSELVKMQPQELAEIVKEYEKSEYKKYSHVLILILNYIVYMMTLIAKKLTWIILFLLQSEAIWIRIYMRFSRKNLKILIRMDIVCGP